MHMKKKTSLKERLKKAKNPLIGIKTRDLIITLLALLICFFSGFFGGYACNQSCKRVEASADEGAMSTTFTRVFAQEFVTYFPSGRSNLFFTMSIPSTISGLNGLFPFSLIGPSVDSYTPDDFLTKPYSTVSPAFQKIEDHHITINAASQGFDAADMLDWSMYQLYYDYNADGDEYIYLYNEDLAEGTAKIWYVGTSSDANSFMSFSSLLINQYGFRLNYSIAGGGGIRLYFMIDSSIRYETYMAYMDANFGQYYNNANFFGFTDIYQAFDDGYQQGYSDGYINGDLDGDIEGYIRGYDIGYNDGDIDGYNRGVNERLDNITPWQHIVNGVNSFLNLQIFPGVSISLILSVGFGVILLGFAIKIFLGG